MLESGKQLGGREAAWVMRRQSRGWAASLRNSLWLEWRAGGGDADARVALCLKKEKKKETLMCAEGQEEGNKDGKSVSEMHKKCGIAHA